MDALPGKIEEWTQDKEGRWTHPDFDGLITLRDGLEFKDYFAQRAEPDPAVVTLADRLDKIERDITELKTASLVAAELNK